MSEISGEPAVYAGTTPKPFPRHPKRVILRLRVDEFDGHSPTEFDHAIMAYLASVGRPVDELSKRIHHSHIEPFQPPELKQRSFHIVLDIEKDMLSDPDFDMVEHEVHRVRRTKNGTLYDNGIIITPYLLSNLRNASNQSPWKTSKVERISNPDEEQSFVRQMRHFTDGFYPWAK
ncbi:hypothetical protein FQN50_004417 [Emmonsiellopsis sp. PD_5]|nr:hypothetical protein FQN50_004417 [Emmonsiellopsis sp. PD_5]